MRKPAVDKALIEALVTDVAFRMTTCENADYQNMWSQMVKSVANGAEFFIASPLGVKIVFADAPMNTTRRREMYAHLMRDENGLRTTTAFSNTQNRRLLVTEAIDPHTRPNYMMMYLQKEIQCGAVYNKPSKEAPLHWRPISNDDASALLIKYKRCAPIDHIRYMRDYIKMFDTLRLPTDPLGHWWTIIAILVGLLGVLGILMLGTSPTRTK
jgi:hypothetical protein